MMNSPQPDSADRPSTAPADLRVRKGRRPFGLYMILILMTLQGLFGVFATSMLGLGLLLLPGETWSELGLQPFELLEPLALLVVVIVVVIGLWRYRAWGWYGMMLLLAYWMATDASAYFTGRPPEYGSMVLNVAMVFYLNQREVRDLFATTPNREVNA